MTDESLVVDAVVLDLDGVLVDVLNSYRRAVKESVEIVYGFSVDDSLVQSLKDLGGFNNDWKVTYACALFALLQAEDPSVTQSDWLATVKQQGRGLEAARDAVEEVLDSDGADSVLRRWNREKLRAIFQELYLGSSDYERLEDDSSVLEREGYIHQESILLEERIRRFLEEGFSVGILTGRPRDEALIALDRMGWDPPADRLVAMEDWAGEKPDPNALMNLADQFEAEAVLYVGDTLDDIRTVLNARESDPDRRYVSAGVLTGGLSGETGRTRYREVGADAVWDSVNELPERLESP